jgi:hypothetical protein
MHRHIAGECMSQTPLGQQYRAAEANESRRFPPQFRHTVVGRLGSFDRRHTSLKEAPSSFCQSQSASGALEQTDTEPLLQRSDAPAKARLINADSACRRRKPAVLDDRGKDGRP